MIPSIKSRSLKSRLLSLSFSMGPCVCRKCLKNVKTFSSERVKGTIIFGYSVQLGKIQCMRKCCQWILLTWPTRMISSITQSDQSFPCFPMSVWSFQVMTLCKVIWHSSLNVELLYSCTCTVLYTECKYGGPLGRCPGRVEWKRG